MSICHNQVVSSFRRLSDSNVLKKTTMKKNSVMFASVHKNFVYGVIGLMSP